MRDDVGGAGAIPEARDRPPDVQVPRPATPGLGRGGVAGRREAAGGLGKEAQPGSAAEPASVSRAAQRGRTGMGTRVV